MPNPDLERWCEARRFADTRIECQWCQRLTRSPRGKALAWCPVKRFHPDLTQRRHCDDIRFRPGVLEALLAGAGAANAPTGPAGPESTHG